MIIRGMYKGLFGQRIAGCGCMCHFSSSNHAVAATEPVIEESQGSSDIDPVPYDVNTIRKEVLAEVYTRYIDLDPESRLNDEDCCNLARSVTRVQFLKWLNPDVTARHLVRERMASMKELVDIGINVHRITFSLIQKYNYYTKLYDDQDYLGLVGRERMVHFVKNTHCFWETRRYNSEMKILNAKILVGKLVGDDVIGQGFDFKESGLFEAGADTVRWLPKNELSKVAILDTESRAERLIKLKQLKINYEEFTDTIKRALPIIFDGKPASFKLTGTSMKGLELIASELKMDKASLDEKLEMYPIKSKSTNTIKSAAAAKMIEFLIHEKQLFPSQIINAPYIFHYNLNSVRAAFDKIEGADEYEEEWKTHANLLDLVMYHIESDNCLNAFDQDSFGRGAFYDYKAVIGKNVSMDTNDFTANLIKMPGYRLLKEKIFCPTQQIVNQDIANSNYITK